MQALNDCTNQQLKEQIWEARDHFNKDTKNNNRDTNKQTNKQTNRNP